MAAVVSGPAPEEARRLKADRSLEDADEHIDIEALLSRPRPLGRRRQRPLYKAPEFIKRLSSFEEVTAGNDVLFECQWKAFPKPDFTWFRDETDITHNPRYQIKEGDNGILSLAIAKALKSDEGAYKCRAENQEGTSSTTGYLSVKGDLKEKVLSAQPRKNAEHAVSYPPCLRTIIEQQSLEEREAEDYEPVRAPPRADTWPVMGRSCPDAGQTLAECILAEGSSGSDTSVDSQDPDRVSFNVPLADEEDIDTGFSTPSTAEPELFTLEDISEEGSSISEADPRPPIPIIEPPRFNTPKLRTPTPPVLPNFDDSQPKSPIVETGPMLVNTDVPQGEESPVLSHSPVPQVEGSPYRTHIPVAPRARLIKQTSMDSETQPRYISPDTSQLISPNSATFVNHVIPNGLRGDSSAEDLSTYSSAYSSVDELWTDLSVDYTDTDSSICTEIGSRSSGSYVPFPWSTYILFVLCCGFTGALTDIHPFWFVVTIAVVSIISFKFTLPRSVT